MTFWENFFAEQAFLSQAKLILNETTGEFEDVSKRATCAVLCALALEALLNSLLQFGSESDRISIKQKIEKAAKLTENPVDWGRHPYQEISRLISVRNWLVHYKEPTIGLLGAEDAYLPEENGGIKTRKRSPRLDLKPSDLQSYYSVVRKIIYDYAKALNREAEYAYLLTEDYCPWLIG
jgi:hypothetical protein